MSTPTKCNSAITKTPFYFPLVIVIARSSIWGALSPLIILWGSKPDLQRALKSSVFIRFSKQAHHVIQNYKGFHLDIKKLVSMATTIYIKVAHHQFVLWPRADF